MAITLGRAGTTPPFGTDVISASYTEECETIDVTNRGNHGATGTGAGYRAFKAGFTTKTWEIECHDPTGLVASLTSNGSSFQVMSVTENISIDGAKTFTVTCRELS